MSIFLWAIFPFDDPKIPVWLFAPPILLCICLSLLDEGMLYFKDEAYLRFRLKRVPIAAHRLHSMILTWYAQLFGVVLFIRPENCFLDALFIINEFFYASARTQTSVFAWALAV